MRLKGRYWVVLWLLLFLGTAGVVVTRQQAALGLADRLRRLREARGALEAGRAEAERRIRVGSSLAVIRPKAERLGLKPALERQWEYLRVPPADSSTDRRR